MSATTAWASEQTDEPSREERADRLCERVPRVRDRVDRLLERLQADSEVRGSIAWLTERAEQASSEGHDDLANFLEHRATIRTERIDVLTARADALDDAKSWCEERTSAESAK